MPHSNKRTNHKRLIRTQRISAETRLEIERCAEAVINRIKKNPMLWLISQSLIEADSSIDDIKAATETTLKESECSFFYDGPAAELLMDLLTILEILQAQQQRITCLAKIGKALFQLGPTSTTLFKTTPPPQVFLPKPKSAKDAKIRQRNIENIKQYFKDSNREIELRQFRSITGSTQNEDVSAAAASYCMR